MATPKRQGAKAQKSETTRVNLSLGAEQYRRLFVTAVMSGRSAGDLVTELIETHLRSWAMPARLDGKVRSNDRHDSVPVVRDSAPSEPVPVAA